MSNIYEKNSKPTHRDYNLCLVFAKRSEMVLRVLPIIYCLLAASYQVPSYAELIFAGIRRPPYGLYYPGMDLSRWEHTAIMYLVNTLVPVFCILILNASESMIYIVFLNFLMISKIILNELHEFQMVLKIGNAMQREIKSRMVKIILMHTKYNE